MTIEHWVFWLAVFGNLVLVRYGGQFAFQTAKHLRRMHMADALRSGSVAVVLCVTAGLFPWSLAAGEQRIGSVAMLICLLTPFVVSMSHFWPTLKTWMRRTHMLTIDIAVLGLLAAYALSAAWLWYWAAAAFIVISWFEVTRDRRKMPGTSTIDVSVREQLKDPFGEKSVFVSGDLNNPANLLWPGHHHYHS